MSQSSLLFLNRANCIARNTLTKLLMLLVLMPICLNAAPIKIDNQRSISLQDNISWYFDAENNADIEQISTFRERFIATPGKKKFVRSDSSYWIYIELQATSQISSLLWLLELEYSQLNQVDVYTRQPSQSWEHQQAGDLLPVSAETYRHRQPLFRLKLASEGITEVFLRIHSSTSIIAPLTLWRTDAFYQKSLRNSLFSGLIFGVFISLMLYNLFLFPVVKDKAYLWFSLYLGGFVFFQMAHQGYARLYLWPEFPVLADRAATISLWLCLAGGLLFTQAISRSKYFTPRLDRLFNGLVIITLLLAITVAIIGPGPVFFLLPIIAGIVSLLIPVPLFISWLNHYRPARYALLAFIPIFPGAVLLIARTLSWVDPSFWTEQLLALGTAASALLLSFALADRINLLREERERIQQELLLSEQSAHKERQYFTHRLISAQDYARKKVATDLHDGIGQNLSWLTSTLKNAVKYPLSAKLQDAHQIAQQTVREVRQLSHQLHPYILDQLGLSAAIESVAESMVEQSGLQINCHIDIVEALIDNEVSLNIFRIVQEALSNATRHSEARQVNIVLTQSAEHFHLQISDDGKGLKDTVKPHGLGLESIRQRVELLDGDIEFSDNQPHGLKLLIHFTLSSSE